MRVLVIEDHEGVREGIALQLLDEGHEVTVAHDGDAALALLSPASRLPELILLDLMMPNMSGRTFRRRQLGDPRLSAIPTLVLTAHPVDAATRRALDDTPVLRTPFDRDVLRAAMRDVVEPAHPWKLCSCGRRFDADSWRALPLIGEADNGRGVGERLELRLCACRSTLAWELGRHARSVHIQLNSKPPNSRQ